MANEPRILRRGLAAAAAVVILGAPAAVAAARYSAGERGYLESLPATAVPAVRAPAAAGPEPAAELRASVDATLSAQAAALSRDDVAAFLAPVDAPLQAVMRRRFEALRALRAVGFTAQVTEDPQPQGDGRWRAAVELRFCLAAEGCAPAPVRVETTWAVAGSAPRLVGYTPTADYGPRPWEVSELRAVAGTRVVVATTPRYANRLTSTLAAAEKAAARADRYARWRPRPSRYVVYLAGPEEWSTWYGVQQPAWAAGFAMPITAEHTEIVLNASRIDGGETLNTLTHEFTHVTSLAGVQRNYTDSWLLVEGVAEWVTHSDRPASAYPWLSGTRRYVSSGRWPGTAKLAAPAESASVTDATGRYGVAYLAVRRLATRFGEERLMAFFAAVARDGADPAAAAPELLGADWAGVAADCDRYVRDSV